MREQQLLIARLQERVMVLEHELATQSHVLRVLQSRLCVRDLVQLERLSAGLPPLPNGPYEPAFWRESTHLAAADVEDVLKDLWSSLALPPVALER